MPRSSARNITHPRPKISSDSDTELIQGIIEQNYASIPSDPSREDANIFALPTLQWIHDNESLRFNTMDFTHVSDKIITALFAKSKTTIISFPLSIRHNARAIREFLRDGVQRHNKSLVKKRERF